MKEIIIKKNRKYFRTILSLIIIMFALYFLIFKFLWNPAEHTYFLLRTKEIVIVFSIIGIIFSFLGIYIITKNLFKKNTFLRIDELGIYNGFSIYKNKFIKWEEISNIRSVRHSYNNYIVIFLKKASNKEKGISSLLYRINEFTMGTPYIIYSGELDCSFSELEKTLNNFFIKNKKGR